MPADSTTREEQRAAFEAEIRSFWRPHAEANRVLERDPTTSLDEYADKQMKDIYLGWVLAVGVMKASAAATRAATIEECAVRCDIKRRLASGDFGIIPAELAHEIRALKTNAETGAGA